MVMDILIPERDPRQPTIRNTAVASPNEARIWGLVAAVAVLGTLFIVGVFEPRDRVQLPSGETVGVRTAPAVIVPESPLPLD